MRPILAGLASIFLLVPVMTTPARSAERPGIDRAESARATPAAMAALDSARARLAHTAAHHFGLLFEDKGLNLALHYRRAPEAAALAEEAVRTVARDLGPRFEVQKGKMVWEVKPSGYDKGTAIEEYLAEPPFLGRTPVFVGDDLTDEDAFEVGLPCGGTVHVFIALAKGDLVAELRRHALPPPAVAQGDRDGALGLLLPDDVAIELGHDLRIRREERVVADFIPGHKGNLHRTELRHVAADHRAVFFLEPLLGNGTRGDAHRGLARRLAAAWCELGEGLRPERVRWTRTRRERIDPRPAAVRTIRGVTPARPVSANEL